MASGYPRGAAITGLTVQLTDKSTGDPYTGVAPTVYVTKDGGAQVVLATPASIVHNGNGQWLFDLTAAERDAKATTVLFVVSTIVYYEFLVVSDDAIGPGALASVLDFGTLANAANIWITSAADPSTTIGSAVADVNSQVTFYLDPGSYFAYGAKAGINFSNPIGFNVSVAATHDLSSSVSQAASSLTINVYADIAYVTAYMATRLQTSAWDDATPSDQNKALSMATRAIDNLRFEGTISDSALDGNKFPRGTDTVVPDAVKRACAEESLGLLKGVLPDELIDDLRVIRERHSGVAVAYDPTNIPAHIQSGIVSRLAWDFLKPWLADLKSMRFDRV